MSKSLYIIYYRNVYVSSNAQKLDFDCMAALQQVPSQKDNLILIHILYKLARVGFWYDPARVGFYEYAELYMNLRTRIFWNGLSAFFF